VLRSVYNQGVSGTATETSPAVLERAARRVEQHLVRCIEAAGLPDNLAEAIRYSVLAPGKRLRPGLTLLCCAAVEGEEANALAPAAALELIHNFSLVHDDLPAMDDDELRRGRPTLHVHAGEAMAILAGDAMMSLAFELLAESEQARAGAGLLTRELAHATTCMIVGQVYDTLGGLPKSADDQQKIELIHTNKTGALLRAACRIGGIAGGAADTQLDALTHYGEAIGLMFQIVDDLVDVMQTPEHAGKATNKDAEAGKLTYPGLLGIDESRRTIAKLQQRAHAAIQPLGKPAVPLGELCDYLAVRTR